MEICVKEFEFHFFSFFLVFTILAYTIQCTMLPVYRNFIFKLSNLWRHELGHTWNILYNLYCDAVHFILEIDEKSEQNLTMIFWWRLTFCGGCVHAIDIEQKNIKCTNWRMVRRITLQQVAYNVAARARGADVFMRGRKSTSNLTSWRSIR